MRGLYILEGRTPVPCSDVIEWAEWMGSHDRRVAHDALGDVEVSTVFLGINYNFLGGTPALYETMIFGGPLNHYQTRCATWEAAEAMHATALALLRAATNAKTNNGHHHSKH